MVNIFFVLMLHLLVSYQLSVCEAVSRPMQIPKLSCAEIDLSTVMENKRQSTSQHSLSGWLYSCGWTFNGDGIIRPIYWPEETKETHVFSMPWDIIMG